jgi:hypothetical protein
VSGNTTAKGLGAEGVTHYYNPRHAGPTWRDDGSRVGADKKFAHVFRKGVPYEVKSPRTKESEAARDRAPVFPEE